MQIEEDKRDNYTPDLTALRYTGSGIPVFLYDNVRKYQEMVDVLNGLEYNSNVSAPHYNAVTKNKYVPWYNVSPSTEVFPSYCLEEHFDIDFIEVPEYTIDEEPKYIQGKICYVTLAALQELDAYYGNSLDFDRVQIQVRPKAACKISIQCFTWMNNVDQITEFKDSNFVLKEGLDLVPYSSLGDDVYQF